MKLGTLILSLIFLLCACNVAEDKQEETELSSAPLNDTYTFEEGENIHWETYSEEDYIVIKAWLNDDWSTYSVENTNLFGPLPTLISFEPNEHFKPIGSLEEIGLKTKFDEESDSDLAYFSDVAIFKQKIEVVSGEEFVVKGNVNYMICNSGGCLPPTDYNFEITITP